MKKLSKKFSTLNEEKMTKTPLVFVAKAMLNFFPKLQQKHAYMVIKDWKNGVSL